MSKPRAKRGARWRSFGRRHRAPESPVAPSVHVIAYGPDRCTERDITDSSELIAIVAAHAVTWVDVAGIEDVAQVSAIAKLFSVHGLAIEDIVNVHQRPKVEPYPGHLFVVMRMVHAGAMIETEQASLVLGPNFVLTFQESRPGDCYGPVRARLRDSASRLRTEGADRLFHALVDSMVDSAFPAIETLGERIETLELEILERADPGTVVRIQDIKHDLLILRRIAFPAREATATLYREPNPLIRDETRIYLRDCHDHAVQIMDLVETYRELSSSLMELYLSSVSNRLNEVMKVLTIISTIFIPLSFIAGVYGMNFDPDASGWNMPELRWRLGYPFALGLMFSVFAALMVFMGRKGWLGGGFRPKRRGDRPLPPGTGA